MFHIVTIQSTGESLMSLAFFKYGRQRWNGGCQTDIRQSDSFIVPKKLGNSGGGKGAT